MVPAAEMKCNTCGNVHAKVEMIGQDKALI